MIEIQTREESDFLGSKHIPTTPIGVCTRHVPWTTSRSRAKPSPQMPELVRALAHVKKAAAAANARLGIIDASKAAPSTTPVTTSSPASCTTSSSLT